jgi:Tfp pilus assembly protein PilN
MTQVNLLPPDVRGRQRTRQLTVVIGLLAAVAVAFLLFIFFLQTTRLSDANNKLADQQQENQQLQSQINELQRFKDLKQAVTDKETVVNDLLAQQVLWSGVLRDVSMVIPGRVWLTSMSGTLTAPAPAPSGGTTTPIAPAGGLVASVQFQGQAFDHPDVALWLSRLEEVTGWVNPWVTSSTKSESPGVVTIVQWTGSVDFTTDAAVSGRPGS